MLVAVLSVESPSVLCSIDIINDVKRSLTDELSFALTSTNFAFMVSAKSLPCSYETARSVARSFLLPTSIIGVLILFYFFNLNGQKRIKLFQFYIKINKLNTYTTLPIISVNFS